MFQQTASRFAGHVERWLCGFNSFFFLLLLKRDDDLDPLMWLKQTITLVSIPQIMSMRRSIKDATVLKIMTDINLDSHFQLFPPQWPLMCWLISTLNIRHTAENQADDPLSQHQCCLTWNTVAVNDTSSNVTAAVSRQDGVHSLSFNSVRQGNAI